MCDIAVTDGKSVLPFAILSAASSTGAGASTDLGGVAREWTTHTVTTGSPVSVDLRVQGSLDNVNWFTLGEPSAGSQGVTELSGASNAARPYFRYVRGNVFTLSGGSSPTVTVYAAVGKVY